MIHLDIVARWGDGMLALREGSELRVANKDLAFPR